MSTDKILQDEGISRDDLFLLLNAYKETISLTTSLVNEQKHLAEKHDNIIRKQDDIIDKQIKLCDKMDKVIESIGKHTEDLAKVQAGLTSGLKDNRVECNKEHSTLKTNLIVSYIGFGGLFATLVGVFVKYSETLNILKLIATHFGIPY